MGVLAETIGSRSSINRELGEISEALVPRQVSDLLPFFVLASDNFSLRMLGGQIEIYRLILWY